MLSLSTFRSLSLVAPTQAIRTMAVKAGAPSAAVSAKPHVTKEKSASKAVKAPKTTQVTKTTKGDKPVKAKKAVEAPKPIFKKIEPLSMPKRPVSSWNLFFMEHLDKVKATGGKVTPVVEGANASALWKQLSASEKKVYEDRRQAIVEKYKNDLSSRLGELTSADYKLENTRRQALRAAGKKSLPKLKDPNAPKRPLSSFFLFAHELRQSGKFASLPLTEQSKAFADAWSNASDSEKTRYANQSQVSQEEYKAKKAAYDALN